MNESGIFLTFQNPSDNKIITAEYVQPDYKRHAYSVTTADNQYWGAERTGLIDLKERLKLKKGTVTVAVIDTGVNLQHELLKNRLVAGYDFVDNDNNPANEVMEENHGTHVSGIIAQCTTENIKIMPVRVLDEEGGYDYDIAQGILYAVKNGADIINLSLGGPKFSPYMDIAINYALSKNIVVVAAAGNEAMDAKNFYPSQKKEILVVSSVNSNDDISSFSNYGDSIDLCAPGEGIYSSVPGNKYTSLDGTSMAAPFVAAVSAMIKLDDKNRNTNEIEKILKSYTDDLGIPGSDKAFGEGLINLDGFSRTDADFILISPTRDTICSNSITLKYSVENCIGSTVKFYLESSLLKSKVLNRDGMDTETFNIANAGKGDHILRLELVSKNGIKKSQSVKISKPYYNTSFELQDIDERQAQFPLVYLYWMKGGNSGFLEVKDKIIDKGIVYMNIDIKGLLSKYDRIIAVASTDSMHPDSKVPIYIKNILSSGQKTFKPDSVQAVRVFQELPVELYGDNISIPGSQAYIIPNIEGQYINMIYPVGLSFLFSNTFFIEQGAHMLDVSTAFYDSVVRLDGNGLNNIFITKQNYTKVNYIGVKGASGNQNKENFEYCTVKMRGTVDTEVAGMPFGPETRSRYIQNGNYLMTVGKTLNGNIVNFKRYLTLDSAKSAEFDVNVGGTITNRYLIDYLNKNMKVNVYFLDSCGNMVTGFFIYDKQSAMPLMPDLVLKGANASYYGTLNYSIIPGIDSTGYIFSGQKIPDGDYTLQLQFAKPIPIYDSKPSGMAVKVKNNKFVLSEKNTAPRIINQPEIYILDVYDSLMLDLSKYIQDMDGDTLYYSANKGYIHEGKYYLDTSNACMQQVEIKATDFKSGSVVLKFYVLATDGSINYVSEPDPGNINLAGASVDLASELLEACRNKVTINKLMNSYSKLITREEFCELIMNLYRKTGGKSIASINPFKDSNNKDVQEAYSLGFIKGTSKDKFGPKENLTRMQACEAIVSLARKIKPGLIEGDIVKFADTNTDGYISREQIIVMINKAYKVIIDKKSN